MSDGLEVTVSGWQGTVVINRPPLNILNITTMCALAEAVRQLGREKSLRCIVIRGAGEKAFCAGVDVADHTPERVADMISSFHEMAEAIMESDKVVVAAVRGVALGGGFELVCACDLAVASESAKFGQPEIKLGVFPTIASVLLPNLVARRRAAEMVLLGETITAAEALELGVVNRVFPEENFEGSLAEFLALLGEKSAVSLKWAKKALMAGFLPAVRSSLNAAGEIYARDLMATKDANEGVKSFLEKRSPNWLDE